MKKLLFFFVGMMLLCKSIEASNWYDSVVVRADNGYVTYYDTMSPQKKSPDVIVEWCKMFCHDNLMGRNQIFEVSYNNVTLFSIRYSGIGFEEYYILAYDSRSNKLSNSPFVLNGKWSADNESGFKIPILKGDMIEIKGNDILFRERVHNGTSYNAVLLYCLTFNESLEFDIKYCIEECSLCITPEMNRDEFFVIKREVTSELQVNCFLEFNHRGKLSIGSYSISADGVISNINSTGRELDNWIVTTSGIDPQIFSKKGSSFYFNMSSR